jgi:hypothetical protein
MPKTLALEVEMAPIIETPSRQPADDIEPGVRSRDGGDVPGQMVALVGQLYADEERADRIARTERLIREAELP